jgi:hypothetical protein
MACCRDNFTFNFNHYISCGGSVSPIFQKTKQCGITTKTGAQEMPLTDFIRKSKRDIIIKFGAEDLLFYVLRSTGIHSGQLLGQVLKNTHDYFLLCRYD